MIAWAICDTDGGRHEPRPLVRHLYGCEAYALDIRNRKFDDVKEYYPVCRVRVEIENGGPDFLSQALNEGDGVYRP